MNEDSEAEPRSLFPKADHDRATLPFILHPLYHLVPGF